MPNISIQHWAVRVVDDPKLTDGLENSVSEKFLIYIYIDILFIKNIFIIKNNKNLKCTKYSKL